MSKTLAAAVLAALAMSLSGCGNGDDTKASKAISDSIMKEQKDSSNSFLSVKRKDADCIGDGMVDKIGTDQLKKYGLLTKDLKSKESVNDLKMKSKDASSATSVLFKCTDVESMMKKAIGKSGTIPKTMQACVNKTLTEDNLKPMFTKVFQGEQAAAQKELTEPLTKCATSS